MSDSCLLALCSVLISLCFTCCVLLSFEPTNIVVWSFSFFLLKKHSSWTQVSWPCSEELASCS